DGAKLGGRHCLFALCSGSCNASVIGGAEFMPTAIDADDRGKHRNDDDNGDDVMNALTDIRHRAAQGKSAENHGADPKNPAKNVECQITGVGHLCGPGDRKEEADEETGLNKNDGAYERSATGAN